MEEQLENQEQNIEQAKEVIPKTKVAIVGFAPDSREFISKHYNDSEFDIWGLNELYMEMPELEHQATAWFQLHGTEPPIIRDPNHKQRLSQMNYPVYMWEIHPEIKNSARYPIEAILTYFDNYGEGMAGDVPHERDRVYFNNSISWMIALAIIAEYKEIYIYGVNMAQDNSLNSEFSHQRPSCEFFLGWARGAGIKIYLPIQSDLLRSWGLYGYDDASAYLQKLYARQEELQGRVNQIRNDRINFQNQANMALNAENQLLGALEDSNYMINLGPRGVSSEIRGKKSGG